jgi:nucleoside-diphosphate-sugar epimerase
METKGENMNILITGVSGFIGGQLARKLAPNHNVFGLVREDGFSREAYRVEDVTYLQGDLLDYASLERAVKESDPETIIHTAALTPVRASFEGDKPYQYGQINYLGTVNLVRAAGKAKNLRQFIHASTAESYLSKQGLLSEEDRIGGETPYGVSKAAADSYVQMAGKVWSLPYTILRPANTFGRPFNLPEEARGYLVEKAIISMLRGGQVTFDGGPEPKRSWMRYESHVEAYLTVLGREEARGQIYNVGSNDSLSVGGIVGAIADYTGFTGEVRWGVNPRPHDPQSLCLDGHKLMRLGWRSTSLPDALKRTISYWRDKT